MTHKADGHHECDRCGADVGNGAVTECLVVSDLDPDRPGMIRNLHFCRDRDEDGTLVKGCAGKVLSSRNMKHYNEAREPQDGE